MLWIAFSDVAIIELRKILKHFNDLSISDNDYFFYGINSDIISNTLNVLTNYLFAYI